jgi:glycosyltransferase involved in cell wall biosynthesis
MTMNVNPSNFFVILCSHNGQDFLEEQVRSIFLQGERIHGIRLHDFASKDGTHEVISALKAEFGDRLVVTYHEDAPGAAASFIRALQLSAPDLPPNSLIFFADQDDVWLPDKLDVIEAELDQRELSPDEPFILFHDVQVVDQSLRMTRPTYYTGNPFRVPRDLDRSRLLMANPAIGHTMLLSMPLVKEVIAWPDIGKYMMHDWLAVLIASRIGRAESIPTALSLYRQHDSNILGAYRRRKVPSVLRLVRFADRIVLQAMAFSRAAHVRRSSQGSEAVARSPLEAWCRNGYRTAAVALSIGAAVYGPTWQRKAIGGLLFLRAIIGPAAMRGKNKTERNRW